MQKLHFATTNQGKVVSLNNALSKYGIEVVQVALDLPEPRSDDVLTIAREKILTAYQQIKKPCIAMDGGFFIHSLNGFPKAFVNFVLETIGVDGILKLVQGKSRKCEFRDCIAYLDKTLDQPVFFMSKHKGSLAKQPHSKKQTNKWSQLWSIFIPLGTKKTLAEMTKQEHENCKKYQADKTATQKFTEWLTNKHFNLSNS